MVEGSVVRPPCLCWEFRVYVKWKGSEAYQEEEEGQGNVDARVCRGKGKKDGNVGSAVVC